MARPPNHLEASMARNFHPGSKETNVLVMNSASLRVFYSMMISEGSTSNSRRWASFLEALAMPLQLNERHFMGELYPGYSVL